MKAVGTSAVMRLGINLTDSPADLDRRSLLNLRPTDVYSAKQRPKFRVIDGRSLQWRSALNSQIKNGPILLADNNINDIFRTLRALERNHVKNAVIVVRDGVEALDYLFEAGKYAGQTTMLPEIMLLDLHLPKVGGLELLGLI